MITVFQLFLAVFFSLDFDGLSLYSYCIVSKKAGSEKLSSLLAAAIIYLHCDINALL